MNKANIKISKKELLWFIDTWQNSCGDLGRNCIDDCGEELLERCLQAKKVIFALLTQTKR